ncbi:SESN2 protein, partial [Smithornis capensis]|nr:SESN2 protein [Smithornis capensis]
AHSPSLPCSHIPQILQEGAEGSLRQLLFEAFVSAGRVDHVAMVMGLHPQYLSSFWKTQYLLMRMDGPLPYHKRHYIAIMVRRGGLGVTGGTSQTPPVSLPLAVVGGTVGELGGLSNPPCALQALLKPGEDSWSLAELVQALVLLTHYHSLASFVFGCGIKPEEDPDGGNGCWPPSPHSDSSPASDDSTGGSGGKDAMQEVELLMERMKLLQQNQLEEEGVTQEEMETRFEMEKTESLLVPPSDILDPSLQSNVRCFVEDPEFGYKDFTRRGEQAPPTFRAQ